MNQEIYNKRDIEDKIRKTASQIEELLSEENIDGEQYTKLMYQQLIQGLYLQTFQM